MASPIAIDPRRTLDTASMSRPQIAGVVVTTLLSVVDGYDLLATAFLAPALAREYGVGPAGLGILLSAGLTGTLLGAFLLAPLGDLIGRRPIAVASLAIMTAGMLASALATSLEQLAWLRLVTGIGIGATMVIVNPIASELANARNRAFVVAIKAIGFPIGGAFGGWLAPGLQDRFGWQSVFVLGGAVGLVLVPATIRWLPESLSYLIERRPRHALTRVNAMLTRFGQRPVDALPPLSPATRAPLLEVFGRRYAGTTLRAALFSLLSWMTIFFFLSWQTKMLADVGFSAGRAAAIAGWSSLAGALGVLLFALMVRSGNGRSVSVASVFGLGLLVCAFGLAPGSGLILPALSILIGMFVTAATVALYVVTTAAFETRILATGAGFVIGVGRIGSAIAPGLAGFLFAQGFDRAVIAGAMGLCAIVAAAIMFSIPQRA